MTAFADDVTTYLQHIVAGTSAGFTAELLLFCVEVRNYPAIFKTEGVNPRYCLRWRDTSLNLKGIPIPSPPFRFGSFLAGNCLVPYYWLRIRRRRAGTPVRIDCVEQGSRGGTCDGFLRPLQARDHCAPQCVQQTTHRGRRYRIIAFSALTALPCCHHKTNTPLCSVAQRSDRGWSCGCATR